MGLSRELMYCGPKFLQREHSATTALLSLSIPGQNHLSCNLRHVWSHPKWPFCSWVFAASLNPSALGTHSTFATWSFAFVLMHHSLPSWIIKLSARCLALRRVLMSSMSPLVSASMTSLSHGSSENSWHNLVCSSVSIVTVTCIMSLTMPDAASQSGRTNQLAPLSLWLGPLASDHLWLMASATMLATPGQCLMSVMCWQTMDSSHLVCVELCFLLSRTSHSAWQSVSISIGDLYIIGSKSSSVNFNATNSSMNCSYFSSLGDVCLEQNASGCHFLCHFPCPSVVSNS